jgi:uncharacterized protein with HEPN domain
MSNRSTDLLLADILDCCEKIKTYTHGMSFENFCKSSITIDAVIRNFEIIGEASNKLAEDFKDEHTQIEWHKIIGLRNRIVHDYMGIDYDLIWINVQKNIPELETEITKIKNKL